MASVEELRRKAQAELLKRKAQTELSRRTQGQQPQSLQEQGLAKFGVEFDDVQDRATFLPIGETQEGDVTLAVPGILKEIAESAMLPGAVAQGGGFTPEEATRFSLDFLAPGTQRALTSRPPKVDRKQFLEDAPSTQQLKTAAGVSVDTAKGSGVIVNETGQKKFLTGVAKIAEDEAVTPGLHDNVVKVIGRVVNRSGKEQDVQEIIRQRQLLQDVAKSGSDPEKRIATRLIRELDGFVDNLTPDDLAAGASDDAGKNLHQFRQLWRRAKKSEEIEDIVEAAQFQASGFENGLRIGFRRILKDKNLRKGWTEDELKIMKNIVEGTSRTKMLRLLGKLSFGTRGGSNFLGGSIGVYGAGNILGPLGGALSPVVGFAAQKGVDSAQANAAATLRALAAQGGQLPKEPISRKALANLVLRFGGPTVAAQQSLNRITPPTVTEDNVGQFLRPDVL